ncbi:MAG: GTP-binding protein TypA [candidate division Zixibacteria bacterium RBG_16_50_21]|nr:MAG: GTP-binding protein TypA [candidate division Zixibacteria bacterium RBG_16_50_21]
MERRKNIRNIAIIAHVDHGKTTLVDAMLKQTQAARNLDQMGERILDSMDLERERGITIRAKNASVIYNGVKINIVDTPGHADFGGEVERTLRMADGVLLLVDAKEGPMPQTKFVLRKALELDLKAVVVVNKIDRDDADPHQTVNKTFDLFVHLGADHDKLDFPIVYTSATSGSATLDLNRPGVDLKPLFETILQKIPAPLVNTKEPLQILVLALAYDTYKGKMGIGKITSGKISTGQKVAQIKTDGCIVSGQVNEILIYQGLKQEPAQAAEAGEIVAVAGLPEIAIGETIADFENPRQLPPVEVDQPTVQMIFSVNISPFSGKEGNLVTSRQIRKRLTRELETNVALRVEETDSPDSFLVSGRGELHLAILIEQMRREGFELLVSQPTVILHEKNGQKLEPYELVTVDVPAEYQGQVIAECGARKGMLLSIDSTPSGEQHLEYDMPTRGVIGLKSALMSRTRGTAVLNHVFNKYDPYQSDLVRINLHGSLISYESGISTSYALDAGQERGTLFIAAGVPVYAGMVVGQNARDEDMEINVCREKKLTNMRSKAADEAILLTPPLNMTLELALEYIGPDEQVEVTPKSIRIRKRILDSHGRRRKKKVLAN